jgi:hypothetical protein
MDYQEYIEELDRQQSLNIIFINNIIVENKFKDYIKNLHKCNESITKKKDIINLLIPKIRRYNTRMYNFKKMNLNY